MICFPNIKDALCRTEPGLTLRSDTASSRSFSVLRKAMSHACNGICSASVEPRPCLRSERLYRYPEHQNRVQYRVTNDKERYGRRRPLQPGNPQSRKPIKYNNVDGGPFHEEPQRLSIIGDQGKVVVESPQCEATIKESDVEPLRRGI